MNSSDFDDKFIASYNKTKLQIEKIQKTLNLTDIDIISKQVEYYSHLSYQPDYSNSLITATQIDKLALSDLNLQKSINIDVKEIFNILKTAQPSNYGFLNTPSFKNIYKNSMGVDINSIKLLSEELIEISHNIIDDISYKLDNNDLYELLSKFTKSIQSEETDSQQLKKLVEFTKPEKLLENASNNQNVSENYNKLSIRQNNIVIVISLLTLIWGIYSSTSSSNQSKQQHVELNETIQDTGYQMIEVIQQLIDTLNREHP